MAAGNKLPARADVAKAVRALKDFKGITGTINFNAKGDLTKAKYFIIQVTSADPAKWSANKIDQTLDIAPPQWLISTVARPCSRGVSAGRGPFGTRMR